jgi:prepilin peptidase CpaA
MESSTIALVVSLGLGLAASVEDLWRRRISNATIVAGLTAGLAVQIYGHGWWRGVGSWAGGAGLGLGVFLVFFLLGGMGGGDVKLLAAFGACLGPRQILIGALMAAILGAVWAGGHLAVQWMAHRRRGASGPLPPEAETFPRAPSIFLGILLSFLA